VTVRGLRDVVSFAPNTVIIVRTLTVAGIIEGSIPGIEMWAWAAGGDAFYFE